MGSRGMPKDFATITATDRQNMTSIFPTQEFYSATRAGVTNTFQDTMSVLATSRSNSNLVNWSKTERYRILIIGGWVMTGILFIGIIFLVVTHFLSKREWRKYQQEQLARNGISGNRLHDLLIERQGRGWRKIVYNVAPV